MVEHGVVVVDRRARSERQADLKRSLDGIRARLNRRTVGARPDSELESLMLMHEQLESSMIRVSSIAG